VIKPFRIEEPVLVSAFLPLADVVGAETFTGIAKVLDDLRIGQAVEKHLVYLVTNGFGEARDFAVATVLELEETLLDSRGGMCVHK